MPKMDLIGYKQSRILSQQSVNSGGGYARFANTSPIKNYFTKLFIITIVFIFQR